MDPTLYLLTIFLRTMIVWGIVDSWARRRYRNDLAIAAGAAPVQSATNLESSDSLASDKSRRRDAQRNGTLRFAGRWLLGCIAVLLSATDFTTVFNRSPATGAGIIVIAVLVAAGILMRSELNSSRLWKNVFLFAGWAMATVTSYGCPSIRYYGGEHLLKAVTFTVFYHPSIWILLIAAFLLAFPIGDWIGRFLSRWSEDSGTEQGLTDGGTWLGRLERLLILACVVANTPAGIAVLVTAKGAFRFGEIRSGSHDEKQRKMIEYILIGSMLSYGTALTIGWLVASLLRIMPPVFPH